MKVKPYNIFKFKYSFIVNTNFLKNEINDNGIENISKNKKTKDVRFSNYFKLKLNKTTVKEINKIIDKINETNSIILNFSLKRYKELTFANFIRRNRANIVNNKNNFLKRPNIDTLIYFIYKKINSYYKYIVRNKHKSKIIKRNKLNSLSTRTTQSDFNSYKNVRYLTYNNITKYYKKYIDVDYSNTTPKREFLIKNKNYYLLKRDYTKSIKLPDKLNKGICLNFIDQYIFFSNKNITKKEILNFDKVKIYIRKINYYKKKSGAKYKKKINAIRNKIDNMINASYFKICNLLKKYDYVIVIFNKNFDFKNKILSNLRNKFFYLLINRLEKTKFVIIDYKYYNDYNINKPYRLQDKLSKISLNKYQYIVEIYNNH